MPDVAGATLSLATAEVVLVMTLVVVVVVEGAPDAASPAALLVFVVLAL